MAEKKTSPSREVVPAVPPGPPQPLVLRQEVVNHARAIDRIAANYSLAVAEAQGPMERACWMAEAVAVLREAVTEDMMRTIMAVMNTPSGFMTDRPNNRHPAPYDASVVRECFVQSLIDGFRPVNNEWNIIAGRMMGVLNGWKRKFEELPGLTDVRVVPGTPRLIDGNWHVRVALSWRRDGVAHRLTDHEGKPGQVFVVPADGRPTGADAIISKALRRAYKAAYSRATGSIATETDDVPDAALPEAALPQLAGPTRAEHVLGKLTGGPDKVSVPTAAEKADPGTPDPDARGDAYDDDLA